ncbi:MAG: M23 family metallopeptidase [Patescibacteria group bacterium]|jgi:murein DD-endopeptidase MepM/ murein hydrolase activator NlpD
MFKKLALACPAIILASLLFSCSQESSLVGPDQNKTVATTNVYNSFPWNWHLPYVGNAYVTQGYNGDCWTVPGKPPTHVGSMVNAVDFASGGASSGSPVKACAAGWVKFAGWASGSNNGFGNQVIIEAGPTGQSSPYQNNKYIYRVAHMNSVSVTAGWWVERGQILGYVGTTGASTGPHIHFEVKRGTYPGYGGISGESFPPSFAGGIDSYNGTCGYWAASGQ